MSKTWINFASCALPWLVTASHFLGWHSLSLQVDTVERGVGMCMESFFGFIFRKRFHCVLCFCFWGYIANWGGYMPPTTFYGNQKQPLIGGVNFCYFTYFDQNHRGSGIFSENVPKEYRMIGSNTMSRAPR